MASTSPFGDIRSYFFADAEPGAPGSYESLVARRKIAESLLGKRSPYPKNIGEGIASIGEAIGDAMTWNALQRQERGQDIYDRGKVAGAPREEYLPGAARLPAAAPPAAAPRAPVSVAPGTADVAPIESMIGDTPVYGPGILPDEVERMSGGRGINPELNPVAPPGTALPRADFNIPIRLTRSVERHIGHEGAIGMLSPELRERLVNVRNALPEGPVRDSLIITEGARTPEQQEEYYNDRLRSPRPYAVARPGQSLHEISNGGRAVDIAAGPARDMLARNNWELARRYGITGIRGDEPHYQLLPGPRPPAPGGEGGGREAITRSLLGSGPEGDGSALSFAPPAPAPAPASAPMIGGPDADVIAGPVAAVPPTAPPGPPPPNPPTPTGILPMPAGMLDPTRIEQRDPFAPPAAGAPAAALAAAGSLPPAAPAQPAGAVAAPPLPPPGGAPGNAPPTVLGPALPPERGLGAAPAAAALPSWVRRFGPGPTTPASGDSTSRAPVTAGAALPRTGIAQAPDVLPSQQPLPVPRPQEMEDPGPPPMRPPRRGPSAAVEYWTNILNQRGISDFLRERAQKQIELGEKHRLETQAIEQEEYKNARERWEKKRDEYDKFKREAHDRDIEQLVKLHGLEKTRADLEKAYYDAGLPREQAARQAALDIQKAERAVAEPHRFQAEGTQYEQQYDPRTGRYGPAAVTPGAPAPEEKPVTETQASAKQFVERALPEIRLLAEMKNGVAMTYFKDGILASRLPFGLSNAAVSDDYRRANAAFGNFGSALMNRVSGAAYSEKEMDRTLAPYKPIFGDTERDLEDKTRRRATIVRSVGFMAPADARVMIEQENFDYGASKPIARGLTSDQIKELGPGRRYVGADNNVYQKPIERIRVK